MATSKRIGTPVKGYKIFNKVNGTLSCRDHSFGRPAVALKKMHKVIGAPMLCSNGFHFCKKLIDCFNYYDVYAKDLNKFYVCEVEGHNDITTSPGNKVATTNLKIVKILTKEEVKIYLLSFHKPKPTYIVNVPIKCLKAYDGSRYYYVGINKFDVRLPRPYQYVANIGAYIDVEVSQTNKIFDKTQFPLRIGRSSVKTTHYKFH